MRRQVRLQLQSARVRGIEREVLTPRVRPRHLFLMAQDAYDRYLLADAGGFVGLAELVAVAASEPQRPVFVPTGPEWPEEASWIDRKGTRGLGLLLVHHAAQLRPSDWRELRRRLGPARPVRRQASIPDDWDVPFWRRRPPEKDAVDLCVHADTLVVTGSAKAFAAWAESLWGMVGTTSQDHFHLQDSVTLRRRYRTFAQDPTPDVIALPWTRWLQAPTTVAYDYRWVYPGYGRFPHTREEAMQAMTDDGWSFVREREHALIFRRPLG